MLKSTPPPPLDEVYRSNLFFSLPLGKFPIMSFSIPHANKLLEG